MSTIDTALEWNMSELSDKKLAYEHLLCLDILDGMIVGDSRVGGLRKMRTNEDLNVFDTLKVDSALSIWELRYTRVISEIAARHLLG